MNSEIKNLFGGLRRCALRRALLLLLATATAMVVSDAKASTIIRWGRNGYRTTDVPEGLTNAVQLVANVNRVVSLQADGTALAWGASLSAEAAAVTDAKAVSLGTHHGLLLRSNGLVVAWGTGVAGENIVPA
jgi:alpha-tubulin suppressor-like RCC1 family protein